MGYHSLLLLFTIPAVLGYKTGPPVEMYSSLCTDMIPSGHNGGVSLATDTATPPYTIIASSEKYTAGGSLTVTIQGSSDAKFEGFFIQARRADTSRDNDVAIGTFAYPPPDTKLLMCHSVINSSWSHSDDKDWPHVTAVWKAPAQDEGPIQFRATIVGDSKDNFYVNVTSSQVAFMSGAAVTVSPPPKPDKDMHTKPSTGCTHGVSVLLGAASMILGMALATRR